MSLKFEYVFLNLADFLGITVDLNMSVVSKKCIEKISLIVCQKSCCKTIFHEKEINLKEKKVKENRAIKN